MLKKRLIKFRRMLAFLMSKFILKYNNSLGFLVNTSTNNRANRKYINRFFIKVIANNLFYVVAYPLFFIQGSKTGNRLQLPETYDGVGTDFRSVLFGFEKSFVGKLLIWRNASSALKKGKQVAEQNNKLPVVLFATRSWHFLEPLYDYSVAIDRRDCRFDINDMDGYLLERKLIDKNRSKYYRDVGLELLREADEWDPSLSLSNLETNYLDQNIDADYDVVFIDWLNHNTLWALKYLPLNKRIVVRVHSYEVYTYFPLLIDFGRIDGLVFISEAVKNIFLNMWGWLLPNNVQCVVLQNLRSDIRLSTSDSDSDTNIRDRNTKLCMVQYADEVKDLEFALDIFDHLYKLDPSYTLDLAGNVIPATDKRYEIINSRIASYPAGTINCLGYVNDVAELYSKSGYILSTSIREGSHESVIEGMRLGCIAVIRDWPLLAPYNGAKSAFPNEPVFDNAKAMANYIIETRDEFETKSMSSKQGSSYYFSESNKQQYFKFINEVVEA